MVQDISELDVEGVQWVFSTFETTNLHYQVADGTFKMIKLIPILVPVLIERVQTLGMLPTDIIAKMIIGKNSNRIALGLLVLNALNADYNTDEIFKNT